MERLNCLLAHVRKLGKDSKALMPVAAKLTRDQYHELLVGLKKLKMPNKTELALVPVTAPKEELGKAPSAKSKAATSWKSITSKKGPYAWKSTSICQGQAWKSQA